MSRLQKDLGNSFKHIHDFFKPTLITTYSLVSDLRFIICMGLHMYFRQNKKKEGWKSVFVNVTQKHQSFLKTENRNFYTNVCISIHCLNFGETDKTFQMKVASGFLLIDVVTLKHSRDAVMYMCWIML